MKTPRTSMTIACLASTLCLAAVALAETPTSPQGEAVMASSTVSATVTSVDQKTREFTLRTDDGQESTFVAGDEVKNFAQMQVGDVVSATYSEAFVYEVRKGGTAVAPATAVAAGAATPGLKPAGAIARQTTVTVLITAIDRDVPSVTFQGPAGNTRTIKVRHPEKLQGVSVGDTVEITYTETLLVAVDEKPAE